MPMPLRGRQRCDSRSAGFSLLEMVLALALLTVVLGVVFQAVSQLQQRNATEGLKVDTTQQTRDFVDQMVRDIHDVGYPPGRVQVGNPSCVNNINVSCGLVYFSNTQIRYEGDLDGTGTVYQVWMQLQAPASGNCPCTLQRGVVTKQAALAGQLPTYFTEVNGVLNSGNGAGAATYPVSLQGGASYTSYASADVFDAYDVNANPVTSCLDPLSCSSVRSLQITANVVPDNLDITTKTYPVVSITSKARLNN
jgi:type II secretory pathway pseudopilin PulG